MQLRRVPSLTVLVALGLVAGAVGLGVARSSGVGAVEVVSVDVAVATGSDDAEQRATGAMDLTSSDLELVVDGAAQVVGLRFAGVPVPAGAVVTAAWVQFRVDEVTTAAASLTVAGQASDSAPAIVKVNNNLSGRPRTSASVSWNPAPWPTVGAAGPNQRTPDLTSVIREIVARPDWASGNALAVLLTGTGKRTAESFEGRFPPRLHVEYERAAANAAPMVGAGQDQTVTLPDQASLAGSVSDDGRPDPPAATTSQWSVVSGPGVALFADASSPATSATFDQVGTYVLRLTASDGELVASDDVTVTVRATTAPPEGQFIVQCEAPVAVGRFDPIVFPGQDPPQGHQHEFYGNETVSPASTYASMQGQPTGCARDDSGGDPFDTAAYWHPTLYSSGARLQAPKSTFYYTEGKKAGTISSIPPDLRIIAGDKHATTPQGTDVVYWGCGNGSSVSKVTAPPQCRSGDNGLTLHVLFPDCWDGERVDSADHRAHMAYSAGSGTHVCPSSHPVPLPQLITRWEWTGQAPEPTTLTLAADDGTPTGDIDGMHADFWQTWHQPRLDALVERCINGRIKCEHDGNRRPTVQAGPDRIGTQGAPVPLTGSVADDGLPNPPAATTSQWSVVSGPGTVIFADASSPATTATFDQVGTYVLRLTASDSHWSASDDVTVTVPAPGPDGITSIEVPVATGPDDAEQRATGAMDLTSSDLELVNDGGAQVVGLRFAGVPVPAGAVVTAAWVQFQVDEVTTAATSLTVAGQASDSAASFPTVTNALSNRPRTSASVSWIPAPWPTVGAAGPDQRSPDLSTVIQEIVSRPEWDSGNALAVLVTGTGRRTAEAFEGGAPPRLHVRYRTA